ncbi:MazG nucleotide pyrophosphohydrolase domain-containing protein [Ureibacillus aquaedulcis]|uniref:MazG nucleotide pyrophosphohydrolase domain-containing protein n=1 Tax=Ureibacillus aquaedulcis TaxID=3058421 RepID=A0ABT8GV07_9BACL|nr:MazG nucleotide pyrophosphohydrolase domain-containing protein [Ureibacillus sp. BA0131]MDN4495252.1 MazG nucleotide pyrophosphohydrolase domain-containing protein [Ureibacillus sp. BA0131]
MREIQAFLSNFQKEMNWEISEENYKESKASILHNYMLLTTEVSEVAEEFRAIFNKTYKLATVEGMDEKEAFQMAKDLHKENIGKELSDCIAYLVKFANYLDIDLEESFYQKMNEVKLRTNKDQS